MYSIARDSLFSPKNLIKYHKKTGLFTFLYFLVLILFMSIGGIVYFASYSNANVTSEATGCTISDNTFVCTGANYDPSKSYDIYGFSVYFLNPDNTVSDITDISANAMILQNSDLSIYLNGSHYTTVNLLDNMNINGDFDKAMSSVRTILFISGTIFALLQNVVILLFIIFISTITFLRLKKFITYKKIFKLVIFASTPVALLMTIYDLLRFSDIIFIILLFVAYRSIFILQRELYMQTMIKISQQQAEASKPQDIERGEDIERVKDDEEDSDKGNENE